MDIQEALEKVSHMMNISLVRDVLAGHKSVGAVDEKANETALHQAVQSGYPLLVKAL